MSEDVRASQEKVTQYDLFFTFRHKSFDSRIARLLKRKAERFHIPVAYRADYGASRFEHIFFDKEKHSSMGGLSKEIRHALDKSRYLLVVCTPDTKDSTRINREIEYFLDNHEKDRLLTVLAEGTTATSFPSLLLREYEKNGITFMREEEQVSVDLTGGNNHFDKKRVEREMTKLFARIIGAPYEQLWHLDRRFRLRRMAGALAAGLLVLVVAGGILLHRNRQLRDTGEATFSRYDETRQLAAETLAEKGELLYEKGDWEGAVETALQTFPLTSAGTREQAKAEALLTKALGAYRTQGVLRKSYELNLRRGLSYALFSGDGTRLYTVDDLYDVRSIFVEDGSVEFTAPHRVPIREEGQGEIAGKHRLILLEDEGVILCNSPGSVRAISLTSGETLWEYYLNWENDFRILNNAQDAMAIVDKETVKEENGEEKEETRIKLLDLKNGIIKTESVFQIPSSFLFDYVRAYGGNNGLFTGDDSRFIGAIYVDERRQHDENNRAAGLLYFTWNFSNENAREEISYFHAEGIWEDFTNPIFGMRLDDAENSVMVTRYDTSSESIRMQQVRLDGVRREATLIPQRLRGTAPEEESDYLAGSDMIAVSVNDTIHLFRTANSAYCMSKREDADVLSLSWLDEDETLLAALLNNGTMAVYTLDAQTQDGNFIAKRTILPFLEEGQISTAYPSAQMATEDAAGVRLKSDVTYVLKLQDAETAAVYRPFKDAHAADLTPSLPGAERIRLVQAPGEEALYCFVKETNAPGANVYSINGTTLAVQSLGHATYYPQDTEEVTLATDLRHFLCGDTLYDLQDGSEVFNGHEETLITKDEAASYRAEMTGTGTLYLYQADSDRMVYRGESTLSASSRLIVNADEAGKRLYISDGSATVCLDLATFEQIFTVDGTVFYSSAGNKLFINTVNEEGEGRKLIAFPAYSTEELIAWGEEVLGES